MGINLLRPIVRQRFTAAHELCHHLKDVHSGFMCATNAKSEIEKYAENFASTVSGKVYAVKGYDTDFRICIREEVEDENGKPTLWIQFLARLNGITFNTGADLFENRLHKTVQDENTKIAKLYE